MNYHHSIWIIALFLIVFVLMQRKKRKTAAIINHRKNRKNKESFKMKELAMQFIGKECLIYTIANESSPKNGVLKEITESGILLDNNGNLQAVNLEYVTCIKEWPRNSKGKKKTFFA